MKTEKKQFGPRPNAAHGLLGARGALCGKIYRPLAGSAQPFAARGLLATSTARCWPSD
jgi:hypothetical protein